MENRRNFLKMSGLSGMGLVAGGPLMRQDPHLATPAELAKSEIKLTMLPNRFPRMLHNYYTEKIRGKDNHHTDTIMGLRTKVDAERYQASIRSKIMACLGPLPEKTALNAKVTGKIQRKEYTIEKVMYESRPGFVVTANLYIPKGRPGKRPAVLGACGHTREGKSSAYQHFAQSLALKGYVVLIFDPLSQGERLQYPTPERKSELKWGVTEHIYSGVPLALVGDSMASWFAWDCMRGIDYLYIRSEVDRNHIGVTGNSGGGTQTTWLCGLEPRLTMAAPSCFVNTIRRNYENQEVQDAEQYASNLLEYGLDHFDFIAAMAPKPVILISQEKDFFDVRGTEEVYQKLKHFYGLFGAADNIQMFTGEDYHGYNQAGREAMYGFFNKVTKVSTDGLEPEIKLEEDKDLWCTATGQLSKNESVYVRDILGETSKELRKKRKSMKEDELKANVIKVLNLPAECRTLDYSIFRGRKEVSFPRPYVSDYVLETEKGISVFVYKLMDELIYSRPSAGTSRATLYISHRSMDEELVNDEFVRNLVTESTDSDVYTCDVRGIGQTEPNTRISYGIAFRPEYFYAMMGNLLGNPLLGQRTYDVLCTLDWLKSIGYTEVKIVSQGWGALPATFASVLSPLVKEVVLKNALSNFADIAEADKYNWPLSCMPPNVLAHFDLEDCYKMLQSKNLVLKEPWGANPTLPE